MSVISKDLAGQIAQKLTEKSRIAMEELHLEYRQLVTEFYEKATPKDVKACFKKHKEWFHTRSTICFDGNGFRWERVSSVRPIIHNTNSDPKLELTPEIATQLRKSKDAWDNAKEKYDRLKAEVKQALITLKTYNNIRKELPEAAPYLPPPLSNALVVNFTGLKKELANQSNMKLQKTS